MDPSSNPPPPPPAAVPFTDEPNNNNHPPPPITSPPGFTHPSYADMIYRAIEALKEKNGSSKRAIAKYIEEVYKDQLPPAPTHSTLLTQNLKMLKDNGLLQMVNKSYILPRSVPPPSSSPPAVPQASRPRGRPRKLQAQSQAQQPHIVPLESAAVNANVVHPVWAALGLSDEPQPQSLTVQAEVPETERRPLGRPRKIAVASAGPVVPSATVSPGRRGRPPGSKNKKRPGLPAKAESSAAAGAGAGADSSGTKRRPGRPRKNQQATPIPLAPAAEGEVPVDLAGGDVPVTVATSLRGRPRRNAGVPAAAAAPVGAGSGRGRGRGRGRGGARGRGGGRLPAQARSSFGRPVGRPKKGTTSASTSQNVAGDGNLKRKLEHFQSKVKESLEGLKPHFTHESPVSAIAAIQDLEVLVAMDLNAPLEDETLPQQPQQPPQQQPLQQQQQQSPPQQPLQPPPQHYIPPPHPPALTPQQIYQQQFPQFQQPYQPQQQQPFQPQQQYQPQQYQNQHQQPSQQFQPQLPHHRLFNP